MWNRLFCTGKNDTAKNDVAKTEHPAIVKARELAVRNRENNADTIDKNRIIRNYQEGK